MPTSIKQRKAGFAELHRRMSGGKPKLFALMSNDALAKYLHEPLHKKKKKKGY